MALDQRAQDAYDAIAASRVGVNIVNQSRQNIANLRAMGLTRLEEAFYERFRSLPFILEHRAKADEDAGWQRIKGGTKAWGGVKNPDAKLLSLFELSKFAAAGRGVAIVRGMPIDTLRITDVTFSDIKEMLGNIQINTSLKDFTNFGNVDFVFCKLGVAGNHVNLEVGKAGVARGKPKFFDPKKLYDEGWISLDDWVSYSAGGVFPNSLDVVWVGFPPGSPVVAYSKPYTKTYNYNRYVTIESSPMLQVRARTVPSPPLVKQIAEEVFFGDDIIPGLALTVIEHMRCADPTGTFIQFALDRDFVPKVARVMANIWRLVEAKLPGSMRYYDFKISKDQAKGQASITASLTDKYFA